jgi:hypothetical protein
MTCALAGSNLNASFSGNIPHPERTRSLGLVLNYRKPQLMKLDVFAHEALVVLALAMASLLSLLLA